MHKLTILGGGISGLATAYYSSDFFADIHLIERAARLGGWMQTIERDGFRFECGPRTFKRSRCPEFFNLCQSLQLPLIESEPAAEKHCLLMGGKLRKLPSLYFLRYMLWPLLTEWMRPKGLGDETVASFVGRRFGRRFAQVFFDPLMRSIYLGSIDTLSAESLLFHLKRAEEVYGSLTRAYFKRRRLKKEKKLFLPEKGVESIAEALFQQSGAQAHINEEVIALTKLDKGWRIETKAGRYDTQHLVSALPAHALAPLVRDIDRELSQLLSEIEYRGVTCVTLCYQEDVVKKPCYGYLVPSSESERILGATFDTCAFPTMSRGAQLTVMLTEEEGSVEIAKEALARHLNVTTEPLFTYVSHAKLSLPQYVVGHEARIVNILKRAQNHSLHLVGNYVSGSSIEACVKRAKKVSQELRE